MVSSIVSYVRASWVALLIGVLVGRFLLTRFL